MALDGYDLSPSGLLGVKNTVSTEAGDLPGLRSKLSGKIDDAAEAAKMPQVAVALAELWNGLLALQCEAAENRIANACTALGDVATAYNNADQTMMDDAVETAVTAPALDIDDAKVVK